MKAASLFLGVLFVLCTVLGASIAFAEPVYTVAWEVSDLLDDAGREIRNLAFDIDFGKEFFHVSGISLIVGRTTVDSPPVHGSGYLAPAGIVIDLHIRQHLLVILFDIEAGLGDIFLYGSDNTLIDSGTVLITSVR
ncbi:MAG TPA: hypothetical protein VN260_00745 [Dissulfurispiraceae bacterium]|nr:hypothetical protein [Dissulfurispiraceae bacterium]